MSRKGIERFAEVLTEMQQAQEELLRMGTKAVGTPQGNQDLRLGQLLDDAKEAVKKRFAKITLE